MLEFYIIIKSCFDKTEIDCLEYLELLRKTYEESKKDSKLDLFGKKQYLTVLDYMIDSYKNTKSVNGKEQFPSETLFSTIFPDLKKDIDSASVIKIEDFGVHTANVIKSLMNKAISIEAKDLISEMAEKGYTEQIRERYDEFWKLSNSYKNRDVEFPMDFRKIYQERKDKHNGMVTTIKMIDDLIGGMGEGTVTTIAGFTSHFKSMFAVNVAYYNAFRVGFNIAYLSLETPKDIMYGQYLSRHSYEMTFPKYNFIPHESIRLAKLSQDEEEYLFDVIEPTLYTDFRSKNDESGTIKKRGQTIFLDWQDFDTFSFSEITNVLENIDDKLNGNLDAVIVDYIQLAKFVSNAAYIDDNKLVNLYVAYFRKLAQSFRSGSKKKKLIMILLSQINRGGWEAKSKVPRGKKAAANHTPGKYDLTCLADANEIERGSNIVITTYTDDNMKLNEYKAQIQLLKNRSGKILPEPEKVFVEPEAYIFGNEYDPIGQVRGNFVISSQNNNMVDALSALDDDDYMPSAFTLDIDDKY